MIYEKNDDDKDKDGKSCVSWNKIMSSSTGTHVDDRKPMNKNNLPVYKPTYAAMTSRKVSKKLEN